MAKKTTQRTVTPTTSSAFATDYRSIKKRYPELKGRVAVVTGSGQGIGKGIAARLAKEGMKTVINDINPDTAEATAAELRKLGADATAIPADISSRPGVESLFEKMLSTVGPVYVLVNNAAILERHRVFDVDDAFLELNLATNIRGPYLCSHIAAETMRDNGGGVIISISSVGAARAHWRGLPYDMTKSAIDGMTRAMAFDLAEYNIRVNAIAPGAIRTEKSAPPDSKAAHDLAKRIPLGRFGSPLEVGAMVAFLSSDDAAYVTGQVLFVDGGMTAQLSPRNAPL